MYDYSSGKQDWAAAGLPVEGTAASVPRAGDVARRDVPTCGLDEKVGEIRKRVQGAGWNVCVVVNPERVVFGLLRAEQLGSDPDRRAEEAMRPGPSTFRPNVPIDEMAGFMLEHDLESSPVTTLDGVLVGILRRQDAARAAIELHRRRHRDEEGGEEDG